MRFSCTVLLSVASFLASGNARSESTQSTIANVTFATIQDDPTDVGSKRSLRDGHSTEEEHDREERAALSQALSELKNWFNRGQWNAFSSKKPSEAATEVTSRKKRTPIAPKKLPVAAKVPRHTKKRTGAALETPSMIEVTKRTHLTGAALAKQQLYLDQSFTSLGLHEAGKGLFQSPNMKEWVRLKTEYNTKHGIEDTSEFNIIAKYYPNEDELAIMIETAMRTPKTQDMAEHFQAGQLSKWLREKKSVRDVHKLLFVRKGTAINRKRWRMYLDQHNKRYIK